MTADNLAQDLQTATADLYEVDATVGLLRFGGIGAVFLGVVAIAWCSSHLLAFVGLTAIAGVLYAFWLICTHDMVHGTLTGWDWFDRSFARLISYPMLWPFGLYAEIHRLHHGWNGADLRDPERVQWTREEYQRAHPLMQWYVRHQWGIDILVLGGLGLIVKTLVQALRLRSLVPRIRQQLWTDLTGMVLVQGGLLLVAIAQGRTLQYLLFWLILERVIGAILQTRDHLEHYALWGKAGGHHLTQLYASRNIKTVAALGWLLGGLNYHSVHHAFPGIPFNHLPEAFQRTQIVLQQHGLPPLPLEESYLQEALYLSQTPSLIGEADSIYVAGRNRMILI